MRRARWTLNLLLALLLAPAWAQTLDLSVTGGAAGRAGGELALTGLREENLTADLRLGVVAADPGLDAILGARWSRAATLGLLGSVTLELDGALRTDGHARLRLGGRGVLGPASVALELAARSAAPERFAVAGVAPVAPEPRLPPPVWSAVADVRYRIDRQLLLLVAPGAFASDAGFAARLDGALRARRWLDEIDAVAAWHGWYDPRTGGVAAAVGAGVVWAPRRGPEWHATAWLGATDGAVTPGLSVRGLADLGSGVGLELDLAAQPFRRDVPPYRALAEVTVDAAATELYVRAQGQAGGSAPVGAAIAVGARLPIAPP